MSEPRQLDEISAAIGELKGSLAAIEKYIHEERHGVNNLAQKIDGLAVKIGSDIAAVEARIDVKIEAVGSRVVILEAARHQQAGATNFLSWIFKNWPGVVGFLLLIGIILRSNGFKL